MDVYQLPCAVVGLGKGVHRSGQEEGILGWEADRGHIQGQVKSGKQGLDQQLCRIKASIPTGFSHTYRTYEKEQQRSRDILKQICNLI